MNRSSLCCRCIRMASLSSGSADSTRRLWTLAQHLSSFTQSNRPSQDGAVKEYSIKAEPQCALYDEKVKIALRGFYPEEKVTIHGESITGDKRKALFGSCGHYVADKNGQIDLTKHPSIGGTYTGVDPMGIIWSLQPAPGQPPNTRMAINFVNRPALVTLNTYPGHLEMVDIYGDSGKLGQSLASVELKRWFKSDDVTRIEVEEGNIRGALFLPPGDGPFQGVIDMFGSAGGLIEYRAALLASRGFATLSLAYFGYKDLPSDVMEYFTEQQKYDYFEEAINWLSSHPKVYENGIGVVGVSKGAEFGLCMGAFSSKVTAVVSINGLNNIGIGKLFHQGKIKLQGGRFVMHEDCMTPEGMNSSLCFTNDGDIIPIWEGKAKHLMLVSGDDGQVDVNSYKILYDACPEEKKKDIEIVDYPGAGHLLEPPYNALCRSNINRAFDIMMFWGGKPKEHAYAQEDSWKRILHFLDKNIPKT